MKGALTARFRYLSGKYGRLLVVTLVVVGGIGFATAAGTAMAGPETQQVTAQTNPQTVTTTLTTSATVTGNTTLYERNETLTNAPVYLRSATPNLTVRATTAVPETERVAVTQTVVLELRATKNGEQFWMEKRPLGHTATNTTTGEVTTTVSLDVESLADGRLAAVRDRVGTAGTIETRLYATASYDTGTYADRMNASTPLTVTERAYELQTPDQSQRNYATSTVRTVNSSAAASGVALPGVGTEVPLRALGWGLLGFIALGGALVVGTTARRIEDFEAFEQEYDRRRYDEWISRGRLPKTGRYARVPVESLLDLVDIAIDSEKRVIHDTSESIYAVVDGNLVYEFRDGRQSRDTLYDEFGMVSFEQELPSSGASGTVPEWDQQGSNGADSEADTVSAADRNGESADDADWVDS
jgi:hypothetical protein